MTRPTRLTRREFAGVLAASALFRPIVFPAARAADGPRLKRIVHHGMLIADCPLPGETRDRNVVPAHPGGLQLAKDRFLVMYATRGFRGIDDDRSICYQLRRSSYHGPILAEGFLSRSIDDWKPADGGGKPYFKQHGHPVAFGVPKGALIGGKVPAHAGVFVAKWRTRGIAVGPDGQLIEADKSRVGQGVEWLQFTLNADESDIQIIQPLSTLRQKGYETGPAICSLTRYGWMNQTYVNAVPFNDDASEWVDVNHFAGDRIAALRYAFNAALGRYEWVQTGPWLIDDKGGVSEASVIRWGSDWLVGCRLAGAPIDKPDRPKRGAHGVGWLRTHDLFSQKGAIAFPAVPNPQGGRTAYRCADGVLRVFAGDATVPPGNGKPRNKRNPIYMWDIDPDRDYAPSRPQMIFDAWKASLTMRPDSVPMCDMIKLMHPLGASQTLLHRLTFAPNNFPPTAEEIQACGVWRAGLEYDAPPTPAWNFI